VSLAAFSVFNFISEFGVILAGLIASSLMGIIYFLPIAVILSLVIKFKVSTKVIHWMSLIWISSVLALVFAEITKSPSMMIVSTGVFVLLTIFVTTFTSLKIIPKRLSY